MSKLDDDIERGCLENGEPIDAKWGAGWWSDFGEPQPEPQFYPADCPYCGKEALFYGWGAGEKIEFHSCQYCDKTYDDVKKENF